VRRGSANVTATTFGGAARAAALALALTAPLGGCGPVNTYKTTVVQVPQPFGTRAATEVLRDGLILTAVKAQLTALDPDSATSLGVSVRDGVVHLRGTVRDAAALAKDVAAARKVKGVKRVVADVRVDPRGPRPREQLSDFALATRITTALAAQVGPTGVRVHVASGTVTLDGRVSDPKTKAAALATARNTGGVRAVVDRIRVERT
jgi:osmotically-inducible protein OsmY